jgi:hypothetical protein
MKGSKSSPKRPPAPADSTPARPPQRSVRATAWSWKIDGAILVGLAVFTGLTWCVVMDRMSPANWQVPIEYGLKGWDGDTPAILSHVKAAHDGHLWPLTSKTVPELNAPYEGNWNDFPLIEQLIYFLTGMAARVIGLFPATNLAVMLAFSFAACGFFAAARISDCARTWAIVGAIAFALSPYAFSRQLHHLQVLNFWHIPLCVVAVQGLWDSRSSRILSRPVIFATVIGIVSAMLHPYYTNMYLQFVCIVGALHFLRGNRVSAMGSGIVVVSTLAIFFLFCLNVFVYHITAGGNPTAVTREFRWLELSALKPLDMLLPTPDHRLAAFSGLAKRYLTSVAIPGEIPPGSYLGIVCLLCVAWLAYKTLRNLIFKRNRGIPRDAWMILWIVLYAVIGGLNCFAGIGGVLLFRSSNRYSLFIATIALLWAARHISRLKLPSPAVVVLPCLLTWVALWDQIPGKKPAVDQSFPVAPIRLDGETAAVRTVVDSDRHFVEKLEAALPPRSMVFQLPVMDFPETPIRGVSAYEHLRPYLYSKTLRFSFGTAKGRPRERWQKAILEKSLPDIVSELESYGFGAIYVHRGGFDDRGKELTAALAATGRDRIIESERGDVFAVLLNPSATPRLPAP